MMFKDKGTFVFGQPIEQIRTDHAAGRSFRKKVQRVSGSRLPHGCAAIGRQPAAPADFDHAERRIFAELLSDRGSVEQARVRKQAQILVDPRHDLVERQFDLFRI